MQCDIKLELDNTDLENNSEHPENCPNTITISNTSEKLPKSPQLLLLHRSNIIHNHPLYLHDYQQ